MGGLNTIGAAPSGGGLLDSAELARKAVEVALEKQAADILMLDLRGVCGFTDYFVICSAETPRQVDTICEEVDKALANELSWHRREGKADSGWVLLDYGDVVVHVFAPRERQYYQLEQVWSQAPTVVRIQ